MTTKAFRNNLHKEMKALQNGFANISHSKQIAKLAGQIIYSKRLDIETASLNLKIMKATKANEYTNPDVKSVSL